MKILTHIISITKTEAKKYFQKKCQKKITQFESLKMRRKKMLYCPHCKEEYQYVRRGKRDRTLRSSGGIIYFKVQQIQCKNCNKIYRPLLDWLGISPRQMITEELLDKSIEVAIHTSYKVASNITETLTGEKIGSRKIQFQMIKKSDEIKQHKANEPPKTYKVILKDSTKANTGKTTRGEDVNIAYAVSGRKLTVNKETGEITRQRLVGDIISVSVGDDSNFKTQHKTEHVMTDGDRSIQKKTKHMQKDQEITFHRCNWHLSRMLGYALYNDGLKTKKQRRKFVSKLANIIKYSFKNYRRYYKELMNELKDLEHFKAVKYLKNAEQEFYNTKEKPVMIDGIPLLSNSPVERVMREIDRRVDNGARWSKKGLEAITNVRLHYLYNL